MDHSGMVRRNDLVLRAEYPELITTIYRTGKNNFLIHCENLKEDFNEFKSNFNYSIKIAGIPVNLCKEKPIHYIEVIPSIPDNEISKGFEGIPMAKAPFLNLLSEKFPKVPFYNISDKGRSVKIHITSFQEKQGDTIHYHFLNKSDKKALRLFLDGLKWSVPFEIIDEQPLTESQEKELDKSGSFFFAKHLGKSKEQDFVQRDKALWYDNVDSIFSGDFKKEDLFFYNPSEYTCYVDNSLFPSIDLRNHLFLYETIYLSPPIEKPIREWLKKSKISQTQLNELINRGRIKLLLPHHEARYDLGYLEDIYSFQPDALITRKALATLKQIELVDMFNGYLFNDPKTLLELKEFCANFPDFSQQKSRHLYDLLAWPVKTYRNSFQHLNLSGQVDFSSFGNNPNSKIDSKDSKFEFIVHSDPVNIAHALNATYFPFKADDGYSDAGYAAMIGEMLNFYKNTTPNKITTYLENKQDAGKGKKPINPIDVMEFNDFIPITELEEVLSKEVVAKGQSLMRTLSGLSNEERMVKVNQYNQELEKLIGRKIKRKSLIDLGSNLVTDLAGHWAGISFLGTATSLMKIGSKKSFRSIPFFKHASKKLEDALRTSPEEKNIHFLSEINRVAKLKSDLN